MSRRFLVFNPQETRLGPVAIESIEVWSICRNVKHPQFTNLMFRDQHTTVLHPIEVVAKALDIQLVEVVNPKT